MARKIDGDGLPSIEDIVANMDKKKPSHTPGEKVAGQPKEPGDTSETVVDTTDGEAPSGGGMDAVDDVVEAVEEGVEEAPVVEEKPAEKKDFLASKFAALARKEKSARDAQAEADRRNTDIETKLKAIEAREAKFASAKSPIEVMKAHGWSYQDITEAQLGVYKEPVKDPADLKLDERFAPVSSQLEQASKDIAELREKLKSYEEEKTQNQTNQFRSSIVETAKAEGCELIVEAGDEAVNLVQEVMTQYYVKHKKLLSFSEACATVETYYTDRISKLAGVEKIRSRFASTSTTPPATKPQKEVKSPNTLTQSLSQGQRATVDIDKLPKHEALEQLAKRLKYS